MSTVNLEIRGIAELRHALGNLPAELKGQATSIVVDAAYAAQADIISQYPTGPGTSKKGRKIPPGQLKKGVRVFVKEMTAFAVALQVRSTSPHAWWHEHGHELKPRETHKGWPRGTMFGVKGIPQPVFVPTMIRHRRIMFEKLAALIRTTGLKVNIDEAA